MAQLNLSIQVTHMAKIFTRRFRVRFSEGNAFGIVSSSHILRYFVEAAWDWGASEDLGLQQSEQARLLWLIREMEFESFRPLRINDSFYVTVWLMEWKRVRGARGFEIRSSENDELLVRGVNQIALLDSENLRLIPAPEGMIERFLLENPRTIPNHRFPRFSEAPKGAFHTFRQVEWRDLDLYEHVNNAIYTDYIEEAAMQSLAAIGWPVSRFLQQGLAVVNKQVHIQFQEPALWGEALEITTWASDLTISGGQRWTLVTRQSDGASIAAQHTIWEIIDLHTADVVVLPEQLQLSLQL